MDVEFEPLSECAITIRWGRRIDEKLNEKVLQAMRAIEDDPFPGFEECVPAYASLTVYYNPMKWAKKGSIEVFPLVCAELRKRLHSIEKTNDEIKRKTIEIPVCYEGELAPDLPVVAEHSGRTEEEIVQIHTSTSYLVHMLGFAPGFPYLGGLDPRIATPRRSLPRLKVEAGSVGIAGQQTGIYPDEMPGGWQIIGRTPSVLFDVTREPPTLLATGDRIRFLSISRTEYDRISER